MRTLGSTTIGSASIALQAAANSAPPAAPTIPSSVISASASDSCNVSSIGGWRRASAVSTWTNTRAAYDSFAVNVTSISGFTAANPLNGQVFCQ